MAKVQQAAYKEHLLPHTSSLAKADDDADDSDDEYSDDSDYEDDDEYDYDSEDDDDEEDGENSEDDDDDDDDEEEDEVDEWLKSNTKKLVLDSKKIYDYTKELKKCEPFFFSFLCCYFGG